MMLGYVNVKTEKPFADNSILMKALLTRLSKLNLKKKKKKPFSRVLSVPETKYITVHVVFPTPYPL